MSVWHETHRAERAAYMRQWRREKADLYAAGQARRRERYDSAKRRAHYAANHEQELAYQAAYRAANPEKRRAGFDAWRRANPDKERTRCAKRRARRANAVGTHTTQEWLDKCGLFENRCAYCGSTGPLERDHVIPLTRGGSDLIENIVPACKPCNASKHNRTLDQWSGRKDLTARTQVRA